MTDGAVHNVRPIIEEIKRNKRNCKVHTFGIGSGVSTELIKSCAEAGDGHYYFIVDPIQIEKKVIFAL